MLKQYVFWGGLALVLIGMIATLWRDRRRRLKRLAEEAQARVALASAHHPVAHAANRPVAAPVAGPHPAPSHASAAFDPTATRIHIRTEPQHMRATLEQREEAVLPVSGSAKLVCVSGAQRGHSFPVTTAGLTIGRAERNDIVIADVRVSNEHAWIGIVDHVAVLRDLESTNGTFLNADMDSMVSEVPLAHNDTIFFGGHGGDQYRFLVD